MWIIVRLKNTFKSISIYQHHLPVQRCGFCRYSHLGRQWHSHSHGQYQCCSWPGHVRIQVFANLGIDLGLQPYTCPAKCLKQSCGNILIVMLISTLRSNVTKNGITQRCTICSKHNFAIHFLPIWRQSATIHGPWLPVLEGFDLLHGMIEPWENFILYHLRAKISMT